MYIISYITTRPSTTATSNTRQRINNETMAKSENPIDTYRKQQRKKEVKKNATARIKARDDKVAATRSVEEVK